MTFEIEIAGRARTVAIERAGDGRGAYRVSIDGRAHHVDVRRVGEYGLSLLVEKGTVPVSPSEACETGAVPFSIGTREMGTATISGATDAELVTVPLSREILVAPGTARGELLVTLGGRTVAASVNARRTGAAADAGAHSHGEQAIVAPMPGRVVRVLVRVGDTVAARQGVIVVEAMKMENELRAPKAGRVKDVQVAAGTSVHAGRVLIVIE